MSDFKEIINYLKFFRRGDEASAKNKFYQALILDKSYALSKIPHEDDYIFVEKEAIAGQNAYEYVGNQIDGDEKNLYLLDQPDGETAYYIKKVFNEDGVAVTKYKQIPLHLSDSWEIVNEEAFTIIAVESKSSSLFYSYALNKIIELSLDPVFVYPDYFVYHPEDLSGITDGNYNFNYKDAEGYSSDVADLFLRSVTSPWYNVANQIGKQNVYFEKNNKPGFAHLLPRITQRGNSYFLEYAYYQKGVPFNSIMPNDERPILMQFSYFGAMLEFLNQTVFYEFDNTTSFNDGTRTLFLENYSEVVNNLLRGKTGPQVLEILYYVPVFFFKKIDRDFLWNILTQTLETPVTNAGLNTEDIVLHLLQGINESYLNKNIFLAELINRKSKSNTAVLYRLIDRIDGDNFKKMISFLWKTWKESGFREVDPEKNKQLSITDKSPVILDYRSDKKLGFHSDNATIIWNQKTQKIDVVAAINTGIYVERIIEHEGEERRFSEEIISKHLCQYHPFSPIVIINADNPTFILKDEEQQEQLFTVLPAFVLYAGKESAFWQNIITAAEYALDIASTVSGVGNILKVGRLFKVLKSGHSLIGKTKTATTAITGIKAASGAAELSAGVGNALLKLTGLVDTELGKEIANYLFYFEILSLSGELSLALYGKMQQSAKTILAKEKVLRKTAKNADETKQMDVVVEELRRVAELDYLGNVGRRGRRLGQKLSKSAINDLINYLKKEGLAFEIFPERGAFEIKDFIGSDGKNLIMTKITQAAFVYTNKKAKFCVREGATIYEFLHEFMHFKHSKDLGLENYHSLGGYGTSGELIKEKLVFDKMIEYKEFLTREELKSALEYLNKDIYNIRGLDPISFNFDINKIPEVRKEVDIKKLFHLK